MPRLFVALRPPPEIREPLCALMTGVSGARWQSDAQLHLTLRYIGEAEESMAQAITEALAMVRVSPIAVQLAGVGVFDRRGRVDTLWAGLTPHDGLFRLQHAVDTALAGIIAPPEPRGFMPHMTLARLALAANVPAEIVQWLQSHVDLTSPAFTFSHFSLYESHLSESGADYREIARWALHG